MSFPLSVSGFDWDEANRVKCAKHGVSIQEIETLFREGPRVAPDVGHSFGEVRAVAVGRVAGSRPIFVAFTLRRLRGVELIRPISARYMHAREIARYEAHGS